jgi:hypothetical protein
LLNLSHLTDLATGLVFDSIRCFNDGNHGDGMAGDSVWGATLLPVTGGTYSVDISTYDAAADSYRRLPAVGSFTTAGPALMAGYRLWEFAEDTLATPGATLQFRIGLKNKGQTGSIPTVSARIAAISPDLDAASTIPVQWGAVSPGDTIRYSTSVTWVTLGAARVPGSTALFAVEIASCGVPYWLDTLRIIIVPPTGVAGQEDGLPTSFALKQNYPNPFNPSTEIQYSIRDRQFTSIKVFDLLGREVASLVNEVKAPGQYSVTWNASGMASGVYFCRTQAGGFVQTIKLSLVR